MADPLGRVLTLDMQEITAPIHCPECTTRIVAYTEERSGITTHWCENTEYPGRVRDTK